MIGLEVSPTPMPIEKYLDRFPRFVKGIPDWPGYVVPPDGRIVSVKGKRPRVLNTRTRQGYEAVNLSDGVRRRTVNVHVLVMEAWAGPRPSGTLAAGWDRGAPW